MFRPISLFIGLRYLRARRRNGFVSFISLLSMLGIAVGIWALITVLSVMNGFHQEMRNRMLAMAAHAVVEPERGLLRDWRPLLQRLRGEPEVRGAAPYVEGDAMLSRDGLSRAARVRAILPEEERQVAELDRTMVDGSFDALRAGGYGIVLGRELASHLRLERGDSLMVITPQVRVTPGGIYPRFRRFTVVGIFEVGMHDSDAELAYVHLADGARLYGTGEAITGIRLRFADVMEAPWIGQRLEGRLGGGLQVIDWARMHGSLFGAIQMEKRVMAVILFLIVAVAAFNIVSTLVMVVMDKQADIAILRTMGASSREILFTFVVQGSMIGLLGTLLGVATGVPTALEVNALVTTLEQWLGIRFLPPDVYYISELVSDLHWRDVWLIAGGALLLTVASTLYPAWRAARIDPAQALRAT